MRADYYILVPKNTGIYNIMPDHLSAYDKIQLIMVNHAGDLKAIITAILQSIFFHRTHF